MKKLSLSIAVIFALLVLPPGAVFAQSPQHDHEQQAQQGGMKMGEMKMDATMMDEMAAKKRANTDRITALMTQVKNSTGDAKVSAMAEIIGALLEERTAMREHCASMMSMMKK